MSQSLLALLALSVVTTFAINIQQKRIYTQRVTISREIEEMAASSALEVMEVIRSRAFDQAVLDGTTSGTAGDLSEFTASYSFPTGKDCSVFGGDDPCEAIEHFHEMETALRPFSMGMDTVYFSVDVEVTYVDDDFQPTNDREFHKQVTVSVQDAWPNGGAQQFLLTPITLSRVISYGF